jgi:hypothetical protein
MTCLESAHIARGRLEVDPIPAIQVGVVPVFQDNSCPCVGKLEMEHRRM